MIARAGARQIEHHAVELAQFLRPQRIAEQIAMNRLDRDAGAPGSGAASKMRIARRLGCKNPRRPRKRESERAKPGKKVRYPLASGEPGARRCDQHGLAIGGRLKKSAGG